MLKQIFVTKGVGMGETELAAFDCALLDAGIANFNLLYLSSIIPAGAEVKIGRPTFGDKDFGNRLYVVMAQMRQSQKEKHACASLGWTISGNGSGRGLFVEHIGESLEETNKQVEITLGSMIKSRNGEFGKIEYETASIACSTVPVCALVVAVYKQEKW